MAPEQVKGKPADARSDIFAFGAVLYEMLSGVRAFHRDTAAETMSAILREEPPDLSATNKNVAAGPRARRPPLPREESRGALPLGARPGVRPPGALRVDPGGGRRAGEGRARCRGRVGRCSSSARSRLAGMAATFFLGRGTVKVERRTFRQLTFRRGTIYAARFAPDGQTVVYSSAWDGGPMEIFVGRPESPESRPFGLVGAEVLAISRTGDMAVSLDRRSVSGFRRQGTLAQISVAGGAAPREILERVEWADWAPDGKALAVSLRGAGKSRIEYPVGKSVYETSGWVSHLRVSPDGELVAFDDHPTPGDDGGSIAVVDRSGKKRTLSQSFASAQGLAWGADGRIWFTATEVGGNRALYVTTLSGKAALRAAVPGCLTLQDISREGRMLVTRDTLRSEMVGLAPGETKERDMTWLDWTLGAAIAADGRTILFSETGEGGGAGYSVYIRKTDGSPAVRLGEGGARDLSLDGEWALAIQRTSSDPRLVAYPTRAGEMKVFKTDGLRVFGAAVGSRRKERSHRGGRTGPRLARLPARRRGRQAPGPDSGGLLAGRSHRLPTGSGPWSAARIAGVTSIRSLAESLPPYRGSTTTTRSTSAAPTAAFSMFTDAAKCRRRRTAWSSPRGRRSSGAR